MKKLLLLASFIFGSLLIGAEAEVPSDSSSGESGDSLQYQKMTAQEAIEAYLETHGQPKPYLFDPQIDDDRAKRDYEQRNIEDRINEWEADVDAPKVSWLHKQSFPKIDIKNKLDLSFPELIFPHPDRAEVDFGLVERVRTNFEKYKTDPNALQNRWNTLHKSVDATLTGINAIKGKPFGDLTDVQQRQHRLLLKGDYGHGLLDAMIELEQLQKFAKQQRKNLLVDRAGRWMKNFADYKKESPHAYSFDRVNYQLMGEQEKEREKERVRQAEASVAVQSLQRRISSLEGELGVLSKKWRWFKDATLETQKREELKQLKTFLRNVPDAFAMPEEERPRLTRENLRELAK
jgi:hypothetical protein